MEVIVENEKEMSVDVRVGDVIRLDYSCDCAEGIYHMIIIEDSIKGVCAKSFNGFDHFGGWHNNIEDLKKRLEQFVKEGYSLTIFEQEDYDIVIKPKDRDGE